MQCREALDWLLLPGQGFDATLHRPPGRTFHLPAPAGLAKLDVAHRGILFVQPSVDKHCAVQADFPMTGLQVGDLKAKILQMENVGWTWNSADHGLRRLGNDQLCVRIVGIVTVVLLMKLGGRMRRAGKDEPVFVVVLRGHPVQVDRRFQDRLKALPVLLNSKASKPASRCLSLQCRTGATALAKVGPPPRTHPLRVKAEVVYTGRHGKQ